MEDIAAAGMGARMQSAVDVERTSLHNISKTEEGLKQLLENSKSIEAARTQLETEFKSNRSQELARRIVETIDRELMLLEITNRTEYVRQGSDGKQVHLYAQLQQKRRNYEVFLGSRNEADRHVKEEEFSMNDLIKYKVQYTEQEKKSENIAVTDNLENDAGTIASMQSETHGYLPYIRALVKEVGDGGLFEGEEARAKERGLLQAAITHAEKNLAQFNQILSYTKPSEGSDVSARLYESCRQIYIWRSQELTEITAGIGFTGDRSVAARNGEKTESLCKATMEHMTLEEAFDWLLSASKKIDTHNWQSGEDTAAYSRFYNGCKEQLFAKLQEKKAAAGNDPQKIQECRQWNLKIAYYLSGRRDPSQQAALGWVGDKIVSWGTFGGSETTNFDADFADPAYAAELAKNALDYENLALRYAEERLKKELPLRSELTEARKSSAIAKIPPYLLGDPQVNTMVQMINGNPDTVEGLSAQYATLRNLEAVFTGENPDIQGELEAHFTGYMKEATGSLQTLLEGGWLGSATEADLAGMFGKLTAEQMDAWKLLANIEGHGWLDMSDTTMRYVAMGAKITAMIAAGIALSVVTAGAGMGVVASAVVGGVGMTATSAAIFHEGVDSGGDLVGKYGKDLAVNTVTMGAARYAQAARYLYEAKKAGDVAKGFAHLRTVWKGGTQFLSSVDEMAQIGSKLQLTGRLAAATVEGVADVATGTMVETALEGGDFVNNLVENGMFMGLGYAEFVGPAVRGLKNASVEQVQKVYHYTGKISEGWNKLSALCAKYKKNPKDVLDHVRGKKDAVKLTPEEEQELMRIASEIVKDDIDLTALLDEVAHASDGNIVHSNVVDVNAGTASPDANPAIAKTAPQEGAASTSAHPATSPVPASPDSHPAQNGTTPASNGSPEKNSNQDLHDRIQRIDAWLDGKDGGMATPGPELKAKLIQEREAAQAELAKRKNETPEPRRNDASPQQATQKSAAPSNVQKPRVRWREKGIPDTTTDASPNAERPKTIPPALRTYVEKPSITADISVLPPSLQAVFPQIEAKRAEFVRCMMECDIPMPETILPQFRGGRSFIEVKTAYGTKSYNNMDEYFGVLLGSAKGKEKELVRTAANVYKELAGLRWKFNEYRFAEQHSKPFRIDGHQYEYIHGEGASRHGVGVKVDGKPQVMDWEDYMLLYAKSQNQGKNTPPINDTVEKGAIQRPSQSTQLEPAAGGEKQTYIEQKQAITNTHRRMWDLVKKPQIARTEVYATGNNAVSVVWIKNNPAGTLGVDAEIPKDSLTYRYMRSAPGTKENALFMKAEKMMVDAFYDAEKFLNPQQKINAGFVVEGQKGFGMEAGNPLGTRVSYLRVEDLLKTLELEDMPPENIREFLIGEFVHERVHNMRWSNTTDNQADEIAPHAVQFLSLEGKSSIFNEQMEMGLKNLIGDKYDIAQPMALKVVYAKLQELARRNICKAPKSFAPNDLRDAIASIPAQQKRQILHGIAHEIIETKREDLMRIAQESAPNHPSPIPPIDMGPSQMSGDFSGATM